MIKEIIVNKINSSLNRMIERGEIKILSKEERLDVLDKFCSLCDSKGIKCNRKKVIISELYNTDDMKIMCSYKRFNKIIVSNISIDPQ